MPPIKNKQDLLQYLDAFNITDYNTFPEYFTQGVTMDIMGVLKTDGRQGFVEFIRAQREHMLEHITLDECYFSRGAITAQSTVLFTPLHDIDEVRSCGFTVILYLTYCHSRHNWGCLL